MEIRQTESGKEGRFTLYENEEPAGFIKYEWNSNGNLNATGTFLDEKYRGQHLGENLFEQLINFARQNDVKIFPICPFVVKEFEKHPELGDFLE